MKERRIERRILCADLVEVGWLDQTGQQHAAIANLEEISTQGACIILEAALIAGMTVHIRCLRGVFTGAVCYCHHEPNFGYIAGLEFVGGTRWDMRKYRPRHLLDPLSVAGDCPPGDVSI
jgi:hypothetical protein